MRFIQYVFFPLVLFLAITGCRDRVLGTLDPASTVHNPTARSPRIPDSLAEKAMNSYVGHLGDGLVTLVINYVSGDAVSGYSIQRGHRRNFNGAVQLQGAALHFELEEAGDQPGKFELGLDTTSWKIAGRASQGGEWRQLKAGRRPDGSFDGSNNTWVATRVTTTSDFRDSILTFRPDGLCDFKFYQRPWDSTSQMIILNGNYERLGGKVEGYKVEWEENSYLKPAWDSLVVKEEKFKGYTRTVLTGSGLRLERFSFL